MPNSFESRIAQALTDHGGPPELAAQLVAMAMQLQQCHGYYVSAWLESWVVFHIESEWSAQQFREWAVKYMAAQGALQKRNPIP